MSDSTVLIVEDDADTRAALASVVEDEVGVPVVLAGDGFEAIDRAHQRAPTVVLLDIGLPKADGYAVARVLRDHPMTAAAWIVAVTGMGDAAAAADAGFDQFLTKPVALDNVVLAVRAGLARRAEAERPEIERLLNDLAPLADELEFGDDEEMERVFARIAELLAK